MRGADEYCKVFIEPEQIGRFYILPSSHDRGATFRIYVLPEGEKVIENAGINPPLNNNSIEIYGVTGGLLGWSESYGWLRNGEWQKEFEEIYKQRLHEIESKKII